MYKECFPWILSSLALVMSTQTDNFGTLFGVKLHPNKLYDIISFIKKFIVILVYELHMSIKLKNKCLNNHTKINKTSYGSNTSV